MSALMWEARELPCLSAILMVIAMGKEFLKSCPCRQPSGHGFWETDAGTGIQCWCSPELEQRSRRSLRKNHLGVSRNPFFIFYLLSWFFHLSSSHESAFMVGNCWAIIVKSMAGASTLQLAIGQPNVPTLFPGLKALSSQRFPWTPRQISRGLSLLHFGISIIWCLLYKTADIFRRLSAWISETQVGQRNNVAGRE